MSVCRVCGSTRAACSTLEAAIPDRGWCPWLERALWERHKLRMAYDKTRGLEPEPGSFWPRPDRFLSLLASDKL
jgi:hypothetical protein